jgi:hypothetical protein
LVNNMAPEEERLSALRNRRVGDLEARAAALRNPDLSASDRNNQQFMYDQLKGYLAPDVSLMDQFRNSSVGRYFNTPSKNVSNENAYNRTNAGRIAFINAADANVKPISPAAPPAASQLVAPADPQPGPVIPRALQQSGSSAALAAPGQGTAMSYFKKYEDMMNNAPDMAAMNEYAQQRGRQGSSAMLNSLLANSAGENFAPQEASYLKQAMAARDPLEVSGTNKGFVEDPYAARGERGKAALAIAKELNDSEQLAKREAAADARLGQRLDPDRVTATEIGQSGRRILNVYGPQADAAQKALNSIPNMREALKISPDGVFGPTLSAFAKVGAEFGIESAERAAAASQIADAISKQFGIAKLSEIGGNDTDRELITSIATTYNGSNLREVNNELLKLFETISQKNIRKFNEAQLHARRYGSILRGPEGKTFDDVFDEKERARSGQNNPTATQESASDSISLTSEGQGVFNKYK